MNRCLLNLSGMALLVFCSVLKYRDVINFPADFGVSSVERYRRFTQIACKLNLRSDIVGVHILRQR